jgi:hypothetical protein
MLPSWAWFVGVAGVVSRLGNLDTQFSREIISNSIKLQHCNVAIYLGSVQDNLAKI